MRNAPPTPGAPGSGGGGLGNTKPIGNNNCSVKFMIGVDSPISKSKLRNNLENAMASPNSTNNISGALFSIYPQSKT